MASFPITQLLRTGSIAASPAKTKNRPVGDGWSNQGIKSVAKRLRTDPETGLSPGEAAARLAQHGPNILPETEGRGLFALIVAQFDDAMILLLLGAAIVAGIAGEIRDAGMIALILIINAAIGVFHEIRAQKAVTALKLLVPHNVIVIRSGMSRTIGADYLVPGDLVQISAGDQVPADIRLTEISDLEADEAALTGESLSTHKTTQPMKSADLALGDQANMAFRGTSITRGTGRGIVTATGLHSELGKIAGMIRDIAPSATPLQKRLTSVSRKLALAAIFICIVILAVGLWRGEPPLLMFMTAISLAVAAMPEALPAVVTVLLAVGARKMARHNALIRRLPAVETLGSVTYICADKTGTLTRNRMHVVSLITDDQEEMLTAMALCSEVDPGGEDGPQGEPTELALSQHAYESDYDRPVLEKTLPRVATFAFSSERKRMTTVHHTGESYVAYMKGAPEIVLAQSAAWQEKAEKMASEGMRVLAFARRRSSAIPKSDEIDPSTEIIGLVGLQDPPRQESASAIESCKTAGIHPVMITGDHPQTALAIAKKIGLATDADRVISGPELARISQEEFADTVLGTKIYARVDPAQKIRIVEALQRKNQYVAMTGDGVNDAPALSAANIGVAMGKVGTDVAREAADLILLDDNFASIVRAVREGRRVFDNIRKFIRYVLACNLAEILTIFFAPLFGLPLPLLPLQILWINLVTDGLPGLALAAEKAEPDIMKRPPVPPKQGLFDRDMWLHIAFFGSFMAAVTLATQQWAIWEGKDNWQTMVFTILTFLQLGQAIAVRFERRSVLFSNPFGNMLLIGAIVVSAALHLMIIYTPLGQELFYTAPLNGRELMICIMVSMAGLILSEIWKWFRSRFTSL